MQHVVQLDFFIFRFANDGKWMKSLVEHIDRKVRTSDDLEEALAVAFKKEQFAKKDLLLRENKHVRKLYFIEQGILRTFYAHNDKEVSSWFYVEDQFITSWHGFYQQETSYEYIEALEDCIVYSIEYTEYQKLIETYPKFERFSRLLAEEQLAFIDSFSKGFMFMTAKDKYQLLLSSIPDIELRVQLGYIASFLGISQETLSRIRSSKWFLI